MKKLIIFLIRRKLGLKKYECFRFTNQRFKEDLYFFSSDRVWKVKWATGVNPVTKPSSVSLNWLLDNDCDIQKLGVTYDWPLN